MSEKSTHQRCLTMNRWIIYIFSLIGLVTGSNIAYFIALTVWVWLEPVTEYELSRVKKINTIKQQHSRISFSAILFH